MNGQTQHRRTKPKPRRLMLPRVLVPMHVAGKSRQALEFALPLRRRYGAKIGLLHAVNYPVDHETVGKLAIVVSTSGQATQARLREMSDRFLYASLTGQTVMPCGNAYGSICGTAGPAPARMKLKILILCQPN
jgi:hypothetical protein